jgi:hypothetical protein
LSLRELSAFEWASEFCVLKALSSPSNGGMGLAVFLRFAAFVLGFWVDSNLRLRVAVLLFGVGTFAICVYLSVKA